MFNLDSAISNWRRKMRADGLKAPRVLDELESHLREDIQNQLRSGVAVERAFALAVSRVGAADQLKVEFAKIRRAGNPRGRENLRRWSVVMGTMFVYLMLFSTWYLGARSGRMEITILDIVLGVGAAAPMLVFGWLGRALAKFLPVINKNAVVLVAMGAIILLAVLFRIIFPAISPATLVRVQIVSLWALSPLIGLGNCVSAWFDRCAELRKKSA